MPFKHKLSKRLAILWDAAVLLPALTLLTCAPADKSVSSPTTPSFLVAPSPSGTVLFQESFTDAAVATRGWYDNTAPIVTTAQHRTGSTSALEMHFLTGATTPVAGGAMRHLFPATPTLYVSYWVKYSSNWVGSGRVYHPHEFLVMSDQDGDWDGLSNGWLVAYIEHNYQNGGIPRLALQDNKAINMSYGAPPINLAAVTENRSTSGCNGVVESNVVTTCYNAPPWYNDKELQASQAWFQPNAGPGYKGDWNHVEVYLQLNSIVNGIGQTDGVMQYWFNGTLAIDRHDILYRTAARPTIQFHQFVMAPYLGDGSPVDQYLWVDDLAVATSRPASPAVASVTITPSVVSVAAGATSQLSSTEKDATGSVLSGQSVTWASSTSAVATVSTNGLVTAVTAGTATISATSGAATGTAALTVTGPITNPGAVTDLAVAGVTDTSVTLAFTEVYDGTGKPASYDIRWATGTMAWGTAAAATRGTCTVPLAGTAIGAKWSCTVLGLTPGAAYQFQMIAFRGTLNVNAVFGGLSNVASGTTTAAATTVASVTVSPAPGPVTVGQTLQLVAIAKNASGTVVAGQLVSWTSSNPAIATVNGTGMTRGVAAGSATISATSGGVTGTAALTVAAPVVTNPGAVTNLAVAGVTDTSVTLAFTELNDGTSKPASYDIRWAPGMLSWGSASDATKGTCAGTLAGTAIGARRSCTILGLTPGAPYQFQMVAFRGTLNLNAVFGGLSNVASATTSTGVVPPPPPPPVTGGLVVFQSDWGAGTGTGAPIVTDGGKWANYWEFNNNTGVQLLSVVAGASVNAPGGRNALKVLQRGSTFAANLQQGPVSVTANASPPIVPVGTDYYVRYYMRNDDTSPAGDHIVTVDTWQYPNLEYMRKSSSSTGWTFVVGVYGCGYTYPVGYWRPPVTLSLGVWYRFEYFVHFVDATHVQVHPRLYDAAGTLLSDDATYQQSDPGVAVWNGRSDWTLASYFAAGYSFCVNPTWMSSFGLGNNGQQGAVDTGLPWYYAGVQIRTDRWPGP
jgi:uncharacterized protein YjdB